LKQDSELVYGLFPIAPPAFGNRRKFITPFFIKGLKLGKSRKIYLAEEKIRIALDGLRGEMSIAELCRREEIAESVYYKWSKDFCYSVLSFGSGSRQATPCR